jgi:hypothetical protein
MPHRATMSKRSEIDAFGFTFSLWLDVRCEPYCTEPARIRAGQDACGVQARMGMISQKWRNHLRLHLQFLGPRLRNDSFFTEEQTTKATKTYL